MEKFYPPEQHGKVYLIHYGDNIAKCTDHIKVAGLKVAMQGEAVKW